MQNNLGPEGGLAMVAVLRSPSCRLKKLNMEECQIGPIALRATGTSLRSGNSLLTTLVIGNNLVDDDDTEDDYRLHNDGTAVIVDALRCGVCHVTDLDIRTAYIHGEGTSIAKALRSPNCRLASLNPDYTAGLTAGHLFQIAAVVAEETCQLSHLIISNALQTGFDPGHLGPGVGVAFGTALSTHACQLLTLDIGYSYLGDTGGCAIGTFVHTLPDDSSGALR